MQKLRVQPSLLEYSIESLKNKLDNIILKESKFIQLSNQNTICLHLDLVMKYFARERSILASLSFSSVWEIIFTKLSDKNLNLSIHFMGIEEDIANIYNFLEQIKIPKSWNVIMYLPTKYATSYQPILARNNLQIGEWYNLDQLKNFESKDSINEYLLLTVDAGKSGQKKTAWANKISRNVVKNNPNKNFLLDGGWKIGSKGQQNSQMVSYSSFWKLFDENQQRI